MQKVLVTGAGGFIGYNLCQSLAKEGFDVIGIDIQYPDEDKGRYGFKAEVGDFRNTDRMNYWLSGVNIVIHLASAHLQISLNHDEYWSVNVHSLRPFLELASSQGIQRFIHVSSVGVYGNLNVLPADEKTSCYPQSIYGETKLAGEREVLDFASEKELPVVIVRPAWVFGAHCPRTLKIYRTLLKKRFVMIGDGENLRHPIYINDMISAIKLCMVNDNAIREVLIIAGQSAITTNELIKSFCKVMDLPEPKIRVPYWIGSLLAHGAENIFSVVGKEPPISKRSLEFFNTNNAFSIKKANDILSYTPKYSFEEGLNDCRDWIKAQVG